MAVAWRSTCLILLLVASFQLATIVHAQTDYSFARWFTAAGRAVPDTVCNNAQPAPMKPLPCAAFAEEGHADFKEYEKDKAEAAKRGISFDEIFVEREARARIGVAKREKKRAEAERERAEAKKRQAIQLAVAATIVIAIIVIVFRARRRIAASFSRKWRGKSEASRAWAFGSISWAVGTFLFVWLFDPYYTDGWLEMDGDEALHAFSVMIVPPLFLGAVWFGYKRFVNVQAADTRPTYAETGPKDHANPVQRTGSTTTRIMLVLAGVASFVGSLYTSKGPDEVLFGVIAAWGLGCILAGSKWGVLKFLKKTSVFLADLAWMTLIVSILGFGGMLMK